MPILLTGSLVLFGLSPLQTGFLYSAIPGVLIIVLVLLFMHNRPEDLGQKSLDVPREVKPGSLSSTTEPGFATIMRTSIYPYLLGFVYSGFIGTKYFVWTWFAVFLSTRYHLSPKSAGFLWAFVAAVPPVALQPVAGWLSDRFGRVRCIVIALIFTAALAGVLMGMSISGGASAPLWLLITIAGLFSIFANVWVMVWPLTTIMFPTEAGGPIGGYMNMFAQIVGALAPVVSGYFIDVAGSYTPAFAAGVASALIGAVCALFLKERRVV